MSKKVNTDELCDWFHKFVKNTYNESMHKDCDKRIQNLKSMIKAVSGNNIMPINDLEYTRKPYILTIAGITYFKWDQQKKGQGISIYNNCESLYLNETCYAFRSIVSSQVSLIY
jgi:hypothetical protein